MWLLPTVDTGHRRNILVWDVPPDLLQGLSNEVWRTSEVNGVPLPNKKMETVYMRQQLWVRRRHIAERGRHKRRRRRIHIKMRGHIQTRQRARYSIKSLSDRTRRPKHRWANDYRKSGQLTTLCIRLVIDLNRLNKYYMYLIIIYISKILSYM